VFRVATPRELQRKGLEDVKLETVARDLELDSAAEILEPEWEASQASLAEGDVFFLSPAYARSACLRSSIPEDITEAAVAAAGRIAARHAARAYAWHVHHCLYRSSDYERDAIRKWPSLDRALGEDGRMLYLLALLSGLPQLDEIYRAHSVPDDIARHTLSDVARWLGGDEDGPVQRPWGITPVAVSWLINHMKGELYRVGRLQFQFSTFHYEVRAFRHRASGAVVALSEDGAHFRADGGRVARDVDTGPGAWASRLIAANGRVTGNPIAPDGKARAEQIALDATDWLPVLTPNRPALAIHIPAGGPMAHDRCGESFRRALPFFRDHFPDRPFDAFCCSSWLLDAELQEFLPATANIVRFQREFYLFPVPIGPGYVLSNILGSVPSDLSAAPRRTALQRAAVAVLERGKSLRPTGGGCFLLPDDLDWGSQVYLRQGLPT
jgi:hypothetical protein